MTPQELMISKYEVVAPIPNYPWAKGDVLNIVSMGENSWYGDLEYGISIYEIDKYPHLFRKMEWWEGVKVEDMPEYVKLVYSDGKTAYMHKAISWCGVNLNNQPLYEYYNRVGTLMTACVSELLPATLSEYTAYVNEKNK